MELDQFTASDTDIGEFYESTRTTARKHKRVVVKLDLPRPKTGAKFIKGPLPLDWLRSASRCGNRAEAVALLLWYAAGWQKSNPAKLTPTILAELHVHPKTARRVLLQFQSAGLVDVVMKRGCSPLVTILSCEEPA